MSGGIDSSVTAALLLEQGYEVIGLTMNHWENNSASSNPIVEAEKIAATLNVPLHVVDFKADFRHLIIDQFGKEYFRGRTPNPCIVCNKKIKFGLLLDEAMKLGGDYLATGHYVGLSNVDQRVFVRRGLDRNKDQSYFLFALNQQQLSRCLFPLGDLDKDKVRAHAERLNLSFTKKDESQDICFIPDNDYVSFLEQEFGANKLSGDIVHIDGKVVGQHKGVYRYTIGQRKGLGIGWSEPLYVVGINSELKQVIVGEKPYLSRSKMVVEQCCWSITVPNEPLPTLCQIRYRHVEVSATIIPLKDDDGCAQVVFDQPQYGITPGQAAVFYADGLVIGGGWIK